MHTPLRRRQVLGLAALGALNLAAGGPGRGRRKPTVRRASDRAQGVAEVVTLTRTPGTTPPGGGTGYLVATIPDLLAALADNSKTDIVVANGTYLVSPASSRLTNSLWIGSAFAARTNPVVVRAETPGGVTFDGNNATFMGFLWFADGAHDQEWVGFKFGRGEPTGCGVITFGSNVADTGAPPYNITLRNIEFLNTLTSDSPDFHDHGIYISNADTPGVHDILVDGLIVNAPVGGIQSAIHFFHSEVGSPNATNFTVRNMTVVGTEQAIVAWDGTLTNFVVEDSTITNAERFAVRYEIGGTMTLTRVTSTGSGQAGFFSSLGATPPGVTFGSGTSLS